MPKSIDPATGLRVGKHAALDNRYLAARTAVSAVLGPQDVWAIADHWGLYTGTMTLARNIALMDLIHRTMEVPGDVIEFGCWKGSTLLLFAKTLHIMDPHSIKVCHGFSKWDVGFTPTEWSPKDNQAAAQDYDGSCKGELATLQALIALNELQGAVELYNGDLRETWPAWQAALPSRLLSLVYLDVDLYEPTAAALMGVHDRLSPGGIIAFDQAQHVDWPGEGQAAREFLAAYPHAYAMHAVHGARQPELVLVKKG